MASIFLLPSLRWLVPAGLAVVAWSCAQQAPAPLPSAQTPGPLHPEMARVKAAAATYSLVDLADVDPTIIVELRYATPNSILGRPLYPGRVPCLVAARTAAKLKKAQEYLRKNGCGLKVWDAWRPPEAHRHLWNAHSNKLYVSNPSNGWSKHCYGRAVDVTLVDRQGREYPMPSAFDDFSERARSIYTGPDRAIYRHLLLLQQAMQHGGFTFLDTEWWHFNDTADYEKLVGPPVFAADLGLRLP